MNEYNYYKISKNGEINLSNVNEINVINDRELVDLTPIINSKNNVYYNRAFNYNLVFNDIFEYEELIINYCHICRSSNYFGGIPIEKFINSLFYLGNNGELLINQSHNNIILKIIQANSFDKLLSIIESIENMDKKYRIIFNTIDTSIMIDQYETRIKDEIVQLHNEDYIKIYKLIINDINKKTTLNDNLFIKKIKEKFSDEKIIYYIDFIYNKINELNFIDENFINIYNKYIFINIQKQFENFIETNNITYLDVIGSIQNKIKIPNNLIKYLIITDIIFLILPIFIYNFIGVSELIQILFVYLIRLLESNNDLYINKEYLYDQIFGKNYSKNTNILQSNQKTNYLPQCNVSYVHNGHIINLTSCGESTLLNILFIIFGENGIINIKKLKDNIKGHDTLHKNIIEFFEKNNTIYQLRKHSSCSEFTKLVSNIDNINYVKKIDGYKYDMFATYDNIMKLLFYILDNKFYSNDYDFIKKLNELVKTSLINKSKEETIIQFKDNISCTFTGQHSFLGIHQRAQEEKNNAKIILTIYFRKFGLSIPKNPDTSIFIENIYKLLINFNYHLINIRALFNLSFNKERLRDKIMELNIDMDIKNEILISLGFPLNITEIQNYYCNTIMYLLTQTTNKKKIIEDINGSIIFNIYLLLDIFIIYNIQDVYLVLKVNEKDIYKENINNLFYEKIFSKPNLEREIYNMFYILIKYQEIYFTDKNLYDTKYELLNVEKVIKMSMDKFEVYKFYEYFKKNDNNLKINLPIDHPNGTLYVYELIYNKLMKYMIKDSIKKSRQISINSNIILYNIINIHFMDNEDIPVLGLELIKNEEKYTIKIQSNRDIKFEKIVVDSEDNLIIEINKINIVGGTAGMRRIPLQPPKNIIGGQNDIYMHKYIKYKLKYLTAKYKILTNKKLLSI